MRNGKVIIVDDNTAVLKTLQRILEREFRTVVSVASPALLPALLRKNDVDVVLLDMNFGAGRQSGGDGLFWLDHINQQTDPPAVVLITAFGDVELAVTSLKRGAVDFIVKPWNNEKLLATVVSAWEQHGRDRRKLLYPSAEGDEDNVLVKQLIDFLLRKYATMYGKPFPVLLPEAREKLMTILWSGNLQLLEQSIERALLLHDKSELIASDFYAEEVSPAVITPLTLDEMEKQFIQEVLCEKNGNLTLTAQQLDISRQTLYNKMRKYGL